MEFNMETIQIQVLVMLFYHPMCKLRPEHGRGPAPEFEWFRYASLVFGAKPLFCLDLLLV